MQPLSLTFFGTRTRCVAISCTSGIDPPLAHQLITVLYQALDLIISISQDTSKLTVELLFELHSICMKTCNVLPVVRKAVADTTPEAQTHITEAAMPTSEFELKYTNIMLSRQATKKNVIIAGPPRVQFCPFEDVVIELGRFVHLARVSCSAEDTPTDRLFCLTSDDAAMAEKLAS